MTEEQRRKNIEYWQRGSLNDLRAAFDIAQLAKKNTHSLFFLHLSIEKGLKALFVYKNSDFAPLSHNLLMLSQKCGVEFSLDDSNILSEINEFNLETRYPNEIEDLNNVATDSFTLKYLNEGQRIQKWILDQLK